MLAFLRRILHGLYWRWCHVVTAARELWARSFVEWHWRHPPLVKQHSLPSQLIVSLTSYPQRFGTLARTLRGLLRQTVKADRTILWIAHADMPLVPKEVTDLKAAGLEIRATDDTKSYKKILPALDAFPDAAIATADDDLYYWPTWLEELIDSAGADNHLVTCHRAHEIAIDPNGAFKPYNQWAADTHFRGERSTFFPTNGGGTLFPPGILSHTAEDRQAAFDLCPNADDVWLYWIGRRNGARYKTTGRWQNLVTWESSQDQALWHDNILQGRNDVQIRQMAEKYGYPEVV